MSVRHRLSIGLVGLALLLVAEPRRAPAEAPLSTVMEPTYPGDYNRDGEVTIDEIISIVSSALDGCTGCVDICGMWDFIGGQTLMINQLSDCTFDGTLHSAGCRPQPKRT